MDLSIFSAPQPAWDGRFDLILAFEVLEHIANPDYQTELAQYNIELNVNPRPLPGEEALGLEQELRDSLNDAERRAQEVGARIVPIGILPTIMPEHFAGHLRDAVIIVPRHAFQIIQPIFPRSTKLLPHKLGCLRIAITQ